VNPRFGPGLGVSYQPAHCHMVAVYAVWHNFDSQDVARYAGDGAWRDRSYLVGRRVDQRSERTVRRAADPTHAADYAATGNAAIQTDCRTWREGYEQTALRTSPASLLRYVCRFNWNCRFPPKQCATSNPTAETSNLAIAQMSLLPPEQSEY